jgi:hypothetical protein
MARNPKPDKVYRALTTFLVGHTMIEEGTKAKAIVGPECYWAAVDPDDDAEFYSAKAELAASIEEDQRARQSNPAATVLR